MTLRFKEIPLLPGLRAYGAQKSGFTFMVSFDENHPQLKRRASVKDRRPGANQKTVYMPGPFESISEACDALEAKQRAMTQ